MATSKAEYGLGRKQLMNRRKRKEKIKTNMGINEIELIRGICEDSFFEFLVEFRSAIFPEEPVWNWHIEKICEECQSLIDRIVAKKKRKYDLLINVPPGSTKSTIVSVALPVFAMVKMPSFRTIVGTHTFNPLGLNLSRLSRNIMKSEKFMDVWPNIRLSEDQDTKGYFVNTAGGFRLVSTVGGVSPVGLHGHLLIVDDPLDPADVLSTSRVKIDIANQYVGSVLPKRKVNASVTPMIVVMQRLDQDDPTGFLIAKAEKSGHPERIRHIRLPADINEGYSVSPPEFEKLYLDGLLDPIRLPRDVLTEFRLDGEFTYASQYGQSPVPMGGGMFKTDKLAEEGMIVDNPDLSKMVWVCRYWDKAGTMGGGAYTVGLLLAMDVNGNLWVLDIVRGQWSVDIREQWIKKTAISDNAMFQQSLTTGALRMPPVIGIEQEPGSGGKESAEFTVRRLAGFEVVVDIPGGEKARRAEPFATQLNLGNVKLKRGNWNQAYIDELTFFPRGKYKDQVDAGSGALGVITGHSIKDLEYDLSDWVGSMF